MINNICGYCGYFIMDDIKRMQGHCPFNRYVDASNHKACEGFKHRKKTYNTNDTVPTLEKSSLNITIDTLEESPLNVTIDALNHKLNLLISVLYSNQLISESDLEYIEDNIKKLIEGEKEK